jgi:hypothetical protein
MCIHRHTDSALQSYQPNLAQNLGFLVAYVESKLCLYFMVEADSQLRLLPASILDIHKMFEHIDTLSICIQ